MHEMTDSPILELIYSHDGKKIEKEKQKAEQKKSKTSKRKSKSPKKMRRTGDRSPSIHEI